MDNHSSSFLPEEYTALPGGSSSLAQGVRTIHDYVQTLPQVPGVYRMLSKEEKVLYIGKAKNLKKRVTSYTLTHRLPNRLRRMISQTHSMEFITTHTEAEALLLESNLIKKLEPVYNILLRDDKSSPFIMIPKDHNYPGILKHRGKQVRKAYYFGPFVSAGAVEETVNVLHKVFLLRSCSDSDFSHRKRPCLQYHLKRCSAPCVGYITEHDYKNLVEQTVDFLSGKSVTIHEKLGQEMQKASETFDYERAAFYRDRIRALAYIQSHQDINIADLVDADVMGVCTKAGKICIQVFFFRNGRNYGSKAYFPYHDRDCTIAEVLGAFIGQFYATRVPPKEIYLSDQPQETDLLTQALSKNLAYTVHIRFPKRGSKANLIKHAVTNAEGALSRYLANKASQTHLLAGVAQIFGMDKIPSRIEIYDNSHLQGVYAYGAMVVAGPEGFIKRAYRKFRMANDPSIGANNALKGLVKGGDDYEMMRQVLRRRFRPSEDQTSWPDLVLLDGGQGQLSVGRAVFEELKVKNVTLVAIAKGPERNAGKERFFMAEKPPFQLPANDPILYYLQRLRDEAHRFAITTHRAKRNKEMHTTPLGDIAGVGTYRQKALLRYFGSAKAVTQAGIRDLEIVPGISKAMAQKIYNYFHHD